MRTANLQPFNTAPVNTVATITKAVAVPSSNTSLRNTMPSATVVTQMIAPVPIATGDFHPRAMSQPTSAAMTNGAAVSMTPAGATPSSWLRRPMVTNTMIPTTSATRDQRTARLFIASLSRS